MGDLCRPCCKIGQGQPRVMIYTNLVVLHTPMLHAKFQNHRPPDSKEVFKVFAIYSQGSHLGHLTIAIYTNFLSPFLMFHIELCFDWPSGFREDISILWSYMYIAPGQGQTTPWGQFFFININLLSICILPASFPSLNSILPILTNSSHLNALAT